MLESIRNVFKIPELKKKILFTAFILILYRLGSFIPTPGVDAQALKTFFSDKGQNSIFGLFDLFVGGNFERASVFALGIMPYITSSIVLQLLGSIIPYFEKLRKEGAEGQKKLTQITRYGTILIGIFNAVGIAVFLQSMNVVYNPGVMFTFTTVITMVTGTMVIMWLGEQITENGIGNGISLIIFAGIIARYPQGFIQMFQMVRTGTMPILTAVIVLAVMVAITGAVILVTEAIRKINVQYAKRVIGRKIYGGQSTHIPLRVNSAGVIPIIFAQSVIMFPRTFATFFPNSAVSDFIGRTLSPGHAVYTVLYMGLIIFFAYFYTAIAMNPVEMAENMKKHGGFIPGITPGKNTANYINNILVRITLPGAIFFAIIAVIPEFMMKWSNIPFYFGGTGLIIIVGVALDTLKQIESHLVMRHYDGFMKKGKLRGRSS
ncbi:MAG TPA: preprotein translocase subunit SecY [Candidatus Cloacimonadota bacterium]|nr:preprotein translocase subunit SecY [Candidatus Cloacimonadota bacterium]HOQ79689.1 preprotein translocase subunit SecY [Candidatus Cloacimonadota bacterium]HPK40184.1 preprotein translocase subunit SecY [Candidatus Cloacimonadota bacterium]